MAPESGPLSHTKSWVALQILFEKQNSMWTVNSHRFIWVSVLFMELLQCRQVLDLSHRQCHHSVGKARGLWKWGGGCFFWGLGNSEFFFPCKMKQPVPTYFSRLLWGSAVLFVKCLTVRIIVVFTGSTPLCRQACNHLHVFLHVLFKRTLSVVSDRSIL